MRTAAAFAALVLAGCSSSTTAPSPTVPTARFPAKVSVAPNTYYRDYTGQQRPSLAATSAGDTFDGTTITLFAQMSAPIVDGNTNYYVWGFDRGGATNAPFPDEPNVVFNAVVVAVVSPSGAMSATATAPLGSTPVALPAPVLLAADTLEVTVPASVLPSTGAATAAYRWNLWPRNALGGSAAAQIASFIPDDAMVQL